MQSRPASARFTRVYRDPGRSGVVTSDLHAPVGEGSCGDGRLASLKSKVKLLVIEQGEKR